MRVKAQKELESKWEGERVRHRHEKVTNRGKAIILGGRGGWGGGGLPKKKMIFHVFTPTINQLLNFFFVGHGPYVMHSSAPVVRAKRCNQDSNVVLRIKIGWETQDTPKSTTCLRVTL